jgi:hypothetical protein
MGDEYTVRANFMRELAPVAAETLITLYLSGAFRRRVTN